jgi:hypothetical protein
MYLKELHLLHLESEKKLLLLDKERLVNNMLNNWWGGNLVKTKSWITMSKNFDIFILCLKGVMIRFDQH